MFVLPTRAGCARHSVQPIYYNATLHRSRSQWTCMQVMIGTNAHTHTTQPNQSHSQTNRIQPVVDVDTATQSCMLLILAMQPAIQGVGHGYI